MSPRVAPPAVVAAPVSVLLSALALALLASTLLAPPAQAGTSGENVRQARRIALHQKGDPYRYGAEGPHRFDCSGLVYYAFRKAGYDRIPRSSRSQAEHARRIRKRNLRRGDLMFFHDSDGVYHVAVFVRWRDGRRLMVHSPSTGNRVHLANPWTDRWFAATLRRR